MPKKNTSLKPPSALSGISASNLAYCAVVLWVISLFFPAFGAYKHGDVEGFGLNYLMLGWLGPFMLAFCWYANPLFFAALRMRGNAHVYSYLAIVLALQALVLDNFSRWGGTLGTNTLIGEYVIGWGFVLWFAALCLVLMANEKRRYEIREPDKTLWLKNSAGFMLLVLLCSITAYFSISDRLGATDGELYKLQYRAFYRDSVCKTHVQIASPLTMPESPRPLGLELSVGQQASTGYTGFSFLANLLKSGVPLVRFADGDYYLHQGSNLILMKPSSDEKPFAVLHASTAAVGSGGAKVHLSLVSDERDTSIFDHVWSWASWKERTNACPAVSNAGLPDTVFVQTPLNVTLKAIGLPTNKSNKRLAKTIFKKPTTVQVTHVKKQKNETGAIENITELAVTKKAKQGNIELNDFYTVNHQRFFSSDGGYTTKLIQGGRVFSYQLNSHIFYIEELAPDSFESLWGVKLAPKDVFKGLNSEGIFVTSIEEDNGRIRVALVDALTSTEINVETVIKINARSVRPPVTVDLEASKHITKTFFARRQQALNQVNAFNDRARRKQEAKTKVRCTKEKEALDAHAKSQNKIPVGENKFDNEIQKLAQLDTLSSECVDYFDKQVERMAQRNAVVPAQSKSKNTEPNKRPVTTKHAISLGVVRGKFEKSMTNSPKIDSLVHPVKQFSYGENSTLHAIGVYEAFVENSQPWWSKCEDRSEMAMLKCHSQYAGLRDEGEVEIRVLAYKGPVILVLMANGPVHWVIQNISGVNIKAVVVSGNHSQRVSGIADGTYLEVNTKNPSACDRCIKGDKFFYRYKLDQKLKDKIRGFTSLDITSFQGKYKGSSFNIVD